MILKEISNNIVNEGISKVINIYWGTKINSVSIKIGGYSIEEYSYYPQKNK